MIHNISLQGKNKRNTQFWEAQKGKENLSGGDYLEKGRKNYIFFRDRSKNRKDEELERFNIPIL